LLQNLFFISGCIGGVVILLWAFRTERALTEARRKKIRDDFSKAAGR
jgi:hypothetical protein